MSKASNKISLCGNKYLVVLPEDGERFKALRHGEEWRDLTGDNLILAMAQEIQRLNDRVNKLETGCRDAISKLDSIDKGYSVTQ